nr:MAG TPA: hypothetical protein [Caudoviricetes sp.]
MKHLASGKHTGKKGKRKAPGRGLFCVAKVA